MAAETLYIAYKSGVDRLHVWDPVSGCPCVNRSGVIIRPSGLVICGDCGLPVVEPPVREERP